jgi:hypothetical protein
MAATETGSGNNFSTLCDGAAIPTIVPIFSAMPDSNMTVDIARRWRLPKFKMAVIETKSGGRHLEFRQLANVGHCLQCHRRVRHGHKCEDSRCNRVAKSLRSIFISICGFGGCHLGFP